MSEKRRGVKRKGNVIIYAYMCVCVSQKVFTGSKLSIKLLCIDDGDRDGLMLNANFINRVSLSFVSELTFLLEEKVSFRLKKQRERH
jgi:hypothetical protein